MPESKLKKVLLQISGMTCMSCVGRVEKVLKGAPGVRSAKVQLKPGQATIEFDSSQIDENQLCSLIDGQGYQSRE